MRKSWRGNSAYSTPKTPLTEISSPGTTREVALVQEVYRKDRGEGTTRQTRAEDLFRDGAFERVSREPDVWIVESVKGSVHTVDLSKGSCSCADYEYHRHIEKFACKHGLATHMKAEWLRRSARIIVRTLEAA